MRKGRGGWSECVAVNLCASATEGIGSCHPIDRINGHSLDLVRVIVADSCIDQACAQLASANFSETAQRHNFEACWLVREPWRTRQISGHYRRMVKAGLFTEV